MKSMGLKDKGKWFGDPLQIVGQRVPQIEGVEKADGTALYPEDLQFDGLLCGKTGAPLLARNPRITTSTCQKRPKKMR